MSLYATAVYDVDPACCVWEMGRISEMIGIRTLTATAVSTCCYHGPSLQRRLGRDQKEEI